MPKIDDQPDDPFDNLVLDEDFVKAAEHREASARARMLASRWKKNPPQDTSWRAPVVPLKPRRRRRWQPPLFVLLAAALVVVSMNAKQVHDWAFSKAPGTRADAAPASQGVAPALTTRPTAAPSTPYAEQSPDLQHPFAGSPADRWPSGAAGIALPAARPVGVFPASTVAKDEQLVKDFLLAAYLDQQTIDGGYPQSVLDLLDSDQRGWMSGALAHPSRRQDPSSWVSRFNPAVAVPLADVRVQGVTSLGSDGDHGLSIKADYIFVYAAHPAGTTLEIERSIARRTLTFRFADPARWQVQPGVVVISETKTETGDQRCDLNDGYLTPYFQLSSPPSGTASAPAPSGSPIDPYDLSKPIPTSMAECGQDSRT